MLQRGLESFPETRRVSRITSRRENVEIVYYYRSGLV